MCSNLDRRHFVTLFRYLHLIDSALIHSIPFLKLPHVWWLGKRTDNCRKQKHDQKKTGPVPLVRALSSRHHQHGYHSQISIVAVLQYRPPKCLCRRGSFSHSLGLNQPQCRWLLVSQTQPTPEWIVFSVLKVIYAGVGLGWLVRLASHTSRQWSF